jgi:hypothetical protein
MALYEYGGEDLELLTRLVTRANARQMTILFPGIEKEKVGVVRDNLIKVIREQPRKDFRQRDRVRPGRRRANAAIALLRLGEHRDYFEMFRISNDPEALSQFVARFPQWRVTAIDLLESLEYSREARRAATGSADRDTAHVVYGLILALGNYSMKRFRIRGVPLYWRC